ncbi:MAG: hypothetical protein FD124_527 [Alphaproteobacteria bacterium]|nr:MAG: hypothetical protein FD160_2157 [Caulobacteraceae bacterium]TPW08254.1 MAG: hypothetical protein FD124_527 [Alphaproteobacteria bacterium]
MRLFRKPRYIIIWIDPWGDTFHIHCEGRATARHLIRSGVEQGLVVRTIPLDR